MASPFGCEVQRKLLRPARCAAPGTCQDEQLARVEHVLPDRLREGVGDIATP